MIASGGETRTVPFARLPVGLGATQVAEGDHAHATYAAATALTTLQNELQNEVVDVRGGESNLDARLLAIEARLAELENALCPPGFPYAPSGGFDVCERTVFGVTDEMVKVGSFWIDRYEASLCPGSGALGGVTGGDELGGATTTAAARSAAGSGPTVGTWFQAAQMCANAGKSLCSNAAWQTAASGTLGHTAHTAVPGEVDDAVPVE